MGARPTSRDRIARYRRARRAGGLRPVVLWLPDVNDPDYRARLAEECRRLACLTAEEDAMAAGFAELAGQTEGWRSEKGLEELGGMIAAGLDQAAAGQIISGDEGRRRSLARIAARRSGKAGRSGKAE